MSSFFGRVLGGNKSGSGASATAAHSVKDISECSLEELIAELQRRGFTVQQDGKTISLTSGGDAAAQKVESQQVVEAKVFNVLDAIEKWSKLDRHRNDKDRKFNALWSHLYGYDWARTPKGYCCDANKSVKIGLSEYSKWEDPESAQVLLIQHYDSERPGNYEKRNSWGEVPPVWAIAFSCEEMKELSKSVVDNVAKEGTLIHREPEGDDFDYSTEPWWNESHWLVEGGKITGIRLVTKCTQDAVPNTQLIRFKMRGSTFELIGVEKPKTPQLMSNLNFAIPEPAAPIMPDTSYISTETKALPASVSDAEGNPKIEGDSTLTMRVCKGKPSATNFDDRDGNLCQTLKTPVYAITNPTDTRIAITEFWVDFLDSAEGEEEHWERAPTRVGVETTNYYGQSYTEFVDVHTFEVASHASVEIVLEGTWKKANVGRPAYNGRPHNQRIHAAFPDPIQARASFKDDQGNTKTIYFAYANTPLDDVWSSYEDAVKHSSASDGFGDDYKVEMWLCVENPIDLNKSIILVTTKKENPNHWFIRVQDDRRNLGGSYNQAGPNYFKKMAFKASLGSDKPAEVDVELGGTNTCKLTGLIDYNTKTIYALHGSIHIEHAGSTVAKAEAYAKLDYERVTEEDN